ncbi:MAG: hypothetical protein E7242_06790 [Lachnospiraceae bacterium]|nr:hypothetical protein [Lachnospiraceae bacterium]
MEKTKIKRLWGSLLSFLATAAVVLPTCATTVMADDTNGKTWPQNPRVTFVTRNTIEFGSYPQYDKNNDGDIDWDDATPITWQILDATDPTDVLIVADQILDCKKYNENYDYVKWETCDLRKWLNSTDMNDDEGFYNTAFSTAQKAVIKDTVVINADNPIFGKDGGDDTTDKIFLLSLDEIKETSYKFSDNFAIYDQARIATVTDYAVSQGVYKDDADGGGFYWLRSPGSYDEYASYVSDSGEAIAYGGNVADQDDFGVRPALRINLQGVALEQAEKQVDIKNVDYDIVTMGKDNGNDIVWNVLKVDGEKALLFTSDILSEEKAYQNSDAYSTTWENSDIRAWLNSDNDGFYKTAFTDAEKEAILETTVENSVGDDTNDYVFLLSIEELTNTDYGFASMMRCMSKGRQALDDYWTRSLKESDARVASCVHMVGSMAFGNNNIYTSSIIYVRPAIWVDLTKLGYVKPNPNPTPDSNVTYKSDSEGKLTWTKGSGKDLTFTIKSTGATDDSFEHFDSLKIDNKVLTRGTDYDVTKGSTIVTIKAATLEAMETGEHKIAAVFDNGIYETTLSIQAASPATGDSANIALFTGIAIISIVAAGTTIYLKKKRAFE